MNVFVVTSLDSHGTPYIHGVYATRGAARARADFIAGVDGLRPEEVEVWERPVDHADPVNGEWSNVEYGVLGEDSGHISCIAFRRSDAEAIAADDELIYERRCSDWSVDPLGDENAVAKS